MLKDGETFLTVRAIPVASGRALRRLTPLFSLPAGPAILPCWLEPVHLGERAEQCSGGEAQGAGSEGTRSVPRFSQAGGKGYSLCSTELLPRPSPHWLLRPTRAVSEPNPCLGGKCPVVAVWSPGTRHTGSSLSCKGGQVPE